MEYTSNYHLSKPEGDDIINPTSRTGYNGNFDTLDTTLELVSNKANTNESNITTLQGDVTTLQGDVTDLNAKTGDDIPFESGSTDSISDKINILSNNVSDLQGHDYIVEQGTSGNWTYRKWNNGIAECWGNFSYSSVNVTYQEGYAYRQIGHIDETYPITFASVPSCVASIIGGGACYLTATTDGNTTNTPWYEVWSNISRSGMSPKISYVVKGRWK